jgi:uncharacterized membrane protein HdeD (DUF308 family)
VSLLFACVTLLRPTFSIPLLFFLIGAWALGVGCLKIAEAMLLGARQGRGWTLVSGLATAAVGVVLMISPGTTCTSTKRSYVYDLVIESRTQILNGEWG